MPFGNEPSEALDRTAFRQSTAKKTAKMGGCGMTAVGYSDFVSACGLTLTHPVLLLFDLGGVLVENVGFDRLNALLPSPVPGEELKNQWLRSPTVRSFESGKCTPEVFARGVVDDWRLPLSPAEFLEAFTDWPKGFFAGATELLAALRVRHTVACLSNSNELHWQRFNGFREHFDVALSSHILGELKPDPDCFLAALKTCDATVRDVAFFDDSLMNVTAARALGIAAFHVNGLSEVRQVLFEEGFL